MANSPLRQMPRKTKTTPEQIGHHTATHERQCEERRRSVRRLLYTRQDTADATHAEHISPGSCAKVVDEGLFPVWAKKSPGHGGMPGLLRFLLGGTS